MIRLLLDINVSPAWVPFLASRGLAALHWSNAGDSRAEDSVILQWAWEHNCAVVTQDLDFGALLTRHRSSGPSVILLRCDGTLPGDIGGRLVPSITAAEDEIDAGALLVFDNRRVRVRSLPLRAKPEIDPA